MKISPLSVVKDGYKQYEPGKVYEVGDELGAKFVANGWASTEDLPTGKPAKAVDLRIDDLVQTQKPEA